MPRHRAVRCRALRTESAADRPPHHRPRNPRALLFFHHPNESPPAVTICYRDTPARILHNDSAMTARQTDSLTLSLPLPPRRVSSFFFPPPFLPRAHRVPTHSRTFIVRDETKRETETEVAICPAGVTFSRGATPSKPHRCLSDVGRRESIDPDQSRSAPTCPYGLPFFSVAFASNRTIWRIRSASDARYISN